MALIVKPSWLYSELAPELMGGPLAASRSPPNEWLFAGYQRPAPVQNVTRLEIIYIYSCVRTFSGTGSPKLTLPTRRDVFMLQIESCICLCEVG